MTKVIFALSSGAIFIWLYPEKPSIKKYVELRVALPTKMSMWGNGKSSLRLALFKFWKSTQTLIFPSFLGTTTMLDTHCGYLTTSRNPSFHYFSSFAFTLIHVSKCALLNLCLTALQPSSNGILCTMIFVFNPGISSCSRVVNFTLC